MAESNGEEEGHTYDNTGKGCDTCGEWWHVVYIVV